MDRKQRLAEATKQKDQLEMTPMIDVTFLLLIFFICTIKFKTLEGKLAAFLPKDVGVNKTQAEPKEKIDILVTVVVEGTKLNAKGTGPYEGTGRYTYSDDRRVQYTVGPKVFTNVADLRMRLDQLYAATPERPVTIDPRKGIFYEDVVAVLDAAIQAKFVEISFAASYEK
ncbi:MAG TPA: biopolymer transporter ExbD [Actinomycetota bacterium]|nr:biopolymer transporter ExbD [Actinomycetota bacterium]